MNSNVYGCRHRVSDASRINDVVEACVSLCLISENERLHSSL